MDQVTQWEHAPVVLTVEEAADLLRLSESTVKSLLADGELPGAKVGRQWRISRDAVRAYIEKGGNQERK